jgi:hypothetical protein
MSSDLLRRYCLTNCEAVGNKTQDMCCFRYDLHEDYGASDGGWGGRVSARDRCIWPGVRALSGRQSLLSAL